MRRLAFTAISSAAVTVSLGGAAIAQTSGPTTQLPFDMPDTAVLGSSTKKVFAHYFTPFPVSIDNRAPAADYYTTQFLSPYGENSKWIAQGGYLRERPLPRAITPAGLGRDTYQIADLRNEIRQAQSIGLDGFTVDVLGYGATDANWVRTVNLYDAAAKESDGFKIVIMPDMTGSLKDKPQNFIPMIRELATKSSAFKLADGRVVVSPYVADLQSPAFYQTAIDTLAAEGIPIALFPVFQGWEKKVTPYKDQIVGVSDWGSRTPAAGRNLLDDGDKAHALGKMWMGPVAPQDVRPRSSVYNESENSSAFRAMWDSAIAGNADWVQAITWNDYSESTEIAPSSQSTHGFFDLTAYYTTWIKTGTAPAIKRDAMYAFYRGQSTDAPLPADSPQTKPIVIGDGQVAKNEIELLAFLTEASTVEITIAGKTYSATRPAGMQSFKVPLAEGTPTFRILRNGAVVQQMSGWTKISNDIRVTNLLNQAQSSLRVNPASNKLALSNAWEKAGSYSDTAKTDWTQSRSPLPRTTNDLAMKFTDTSATAGASAGLGYSFVPPDNTQTFVMQFDFKILDVGVNNLQVNASLFDSAGGAGTFLQLFALDADGKHYLGNQTNAGVTLLRDAPINVETWYRVALLVNGVAGAADTYSLMLLDAAGRTIAAVPNLPFRANLNDLAALSVFNNGTSALQGGFVVDNVLVYGVVAVPVPEPAAGVIGGGVGLLSLSRRRRDSK